MGSNGGCTKKTNGHDKKLMNGFKAAKTNGHISSPVRNGFTSRKKDSGGGGSSGDDDDDDDDSDDNETVRSRSSFIDDEAFEKSESIISTDSNEIPVRGESVGSTSSEVGFYSSCDDHDDYELDSVVCSDNSGNRSLLSGDSEDDLMIAASATKPKVKRRRVQLMADSSDDEDHRPPKLMNGDVKAEISPKIVIDKPTKVSIKSEINAPSPPPTGAATNELDSHDDNHDNKNEVQSPKLISVKSLNLMHEPEFGVQHRIEHYLNDVENHAKKSFSSYSEDKTSAIFSFSTIAETAVEPHPDEEGAFVNDFANEKIEIKVHLPVKSKAKKRKRKRTNSCSFVSGNSSSSSDDETPKLQTKSTKSTEIDLRKKIRRKFRSDSTRQLGKFQVKSSIKDPPKHKLFDKVFLIKNRQKS